MKKLAARPRGTIGIVDIGTTKVCCFIARHGGGETEIVGIGHQVSRGVKNGVIIDIEAASQSILAAAHAAEQMAGETLAEVVVNLSGGFNASRLVKSDIALNGREITDSDMRRVLDHGHGLKEPADRVVIHSIPVGFAVDESRGIRDPRGMYAQKLGGQHASGDGAGRRRAQPRHLRRPLPSRDRGAGGEPLRRRPRRAGRGRDAISASPSSTWAAAPPASPCSSTATSSSPTACR